MAWVRIEPDYPDHPKVVGLSDAAFRLHVRAICYCNHYLTDGLLPNGWQNGKAELLKELVSARLVDDTPDGFRLHDFDHYQPSRGEVYAKRSANHESKSRAGRLGAAARWHAHGRKYSTSDDSRMTEGIAEGMTKNGPGPVPVKKKKIYGGRFTPPSLDELKAWITENHYTFKAESFLAHYEANGWVQAKGKPIRSWKASCITWQENEGNFDRKAKPQPVEKDRSIEEWKKA